MILTGRVQNGVVAFDGNPVLPEGATVQVTFPDPAAPATGQDVRVPFRPARHPHLTDDGHVILPIVPSDRPGTLNITNELIAQIQEEEDIEYARQFMTAPK